MITFIDKILHGRIVDKTFDLDEFCCTVKKKIAFHKLRVQIKFTALKTLISNICTTAARTVMCIN